MATCNCKKKSCKTCSGSQSDAETLAQVVNKLNELEAELDQVKSDTQFLQCGSPIMMLHRTKDIECFDLETGLGSDCWEGWVVCDGGTYKDSDNKNVVTPNMFNRFPIGAGDTYEVGDTGGTATETLTVLQMPTHVHTVTDTGHNHAVTDPGHNHAGSSAAHTHTFTGIPHNHTTESAGHHTHNVQVDNQGAGDRSGGATSTAASGLNTFTTDGAGDHTHVVSNATAGGTVGDASATVTVANAFTGITVDSHTTGISIDTEGGGDPHNNLPPYLAVLFVMKLS